jgi:hypothetical protein
MKNPILILLPIEFRKDGWPLCPTCGDDEVETGLPFHEGADYTLEDYLKGPLNCIACGWTNSKDL